MINTVFATDPPLTYSKYMNKNNATNSQWKLTHLFLDQIKLVSISTNSQI